MKLTLLKRLKFAWNVLTYKDKYCKSTNIKGLDLFIKGYECGLKDGRMK